MNCNEITIRNKLGMHARASAKFVTLATTYKCDITLTRNGQQVNGKSIMGIMMLAASAGSHINICAEGHDEKEAINALSELVISGFGEKE
ncbi:MAG: HPr family phosphocarrier protein [Acidiferrobacterales bacterium]